MASVLSPSNRYSSNVSAEFPHKSDLRPVFAACCFSLSIVTEDYQWCGFMHSNHVCCIVDKGVLCKHSRIPSHYCVCYANEGELVECEPICKLQNQLLCVDFRLALPLNFTVPQIVTCCFFTFWYNQCFGAKCCVEVKELQ